jgi:hypothetical protein
MSNTIQIKRSTTAAAVPTAGQLAVGELAVNLVDKKLFTKDALGAVVELTPPAVTAASTAEAQAGTDNTKFISPLRMREGFNASGSAPVYACRAWVNFDGTGTVAIRASGNVSSITDDGTGKYTVNFATAMPDANYAVALSARKVGSDDDANFIGTTGNAVRVPTASTCPITTSLVNFTLTDYPSVYVTIFR